MSVESPDRRDIAQRLAWVVGKVNRRLRPPAEALSHVAVSALGSIGWSEPVRPGDLARLEGIAAPGMTRLVADLEQRGLVERRDDPDDRRSTLLQLTQEGRRALEEARSARAESVGGLIADCTDQELADIRHAVDALEAALLRRVPELGRSVPGRSAERGLDADRQGVDPLPNQVVAAPALLDPFQQR
jgi:DNA-binding MarR family transcriptional regulator